MGSSLCFTICQLLCHTARFILRAAVSSDAVWLGGLLHLSDILHLRLALFGAPLQLLPDLRKSTAISSCFGSLGAVVLPAALQFPGSRAPGFPGSAALRLPAPGRRCQKPAGRWGARAAPPAHSDAGIGGGSAAFVSRALARSRPLPRPKPSPASAVQAPHCRCLPTAPRSAFAVPRRSLRPSSAGRTLAAPEGPSAKRTRQVPRAKPLRRRGSGDPGGRRPRRNPERSRMRQDKLTGSLRRGGRCLKRQGGGGGGGGVGTILSNVLKKRSCISRTAPRLLCTLEPGEDPGLQMGHWKVAWRPGTDASASVGLRLGRGALAGRGVQGTAAWRRRGWVYLGGKSAG